MPLVICGENQAKKLAAGFGVSHVLSINDMGHRNPFSYTKVAELPFRLRVCLFDDTENPYATYAVSVSQCQEILDWFGDIDTETELTLIHCAAGVSRSTACGLAFIFQKELDEEPVEMLRKIRPQAAPNLWLSFVFDKLLKLEGNLMNSALDLNQKHYTMWGVGEVAVARRASYMERFDAAFDQQIRSIEEYNRIYTK